jgi:polyketide biosynthesis acyl carrier protein
MDDHQIMAVLRRTIVEVVPTIEAGAIRPDLSLAELGCNSLDRLDIVTITMADLGVTVPIERFQAGVDLASLVNLLADYA